MPIQRSKLHTICAFLLLFASGCASALDLDFYTYNGFQETVDAFQRIALVFGDADYRALFFVTCVLGLVFGGLAFFGKNLVGGLHGNSNFTTAWFFSVIFGVVIFKALILPKGTVYIYDPVKNDFQAVGDVPDLIIFVSGVLNKIERLVVQISDSSSAYPYANEAGGISFQLLYSATTDNNSIDDYYLMKSVKQYYTDCSAMAMSQASYAFDLNDLRSNTTDLMLVMQTLKSDSAFTKFYDSGHKSGVTYSCSDAWDNHLSPTLLDANQYTNLLNTVCGKSGFNVAVIGELTQCKSALARLNLTVYDQTDTDIHLLRSAALANAIGQAIQDMNPDVSMRSLTNRAMVTEGIGSAMVADDWVPVARSVLFTVVLGITPLLFCFVVTPLVWKALTVYLGLAVWLTLWGVSDVITHSIAMDHAMAVLLEVKRNHMGVIGMLMSPDAAIKAMAIFGKVRSQGVMVASVLSAGLFGFSAYSLSGIASSMANSMEREGTDNANKTISPEGHAQQLRSLQEASATHMTTAMFGMQGVTNSLALDQGTGVQRNTTALSSLGNNGIGLHDAISLGGNIEGGSAAGGMLARLEYAHKVTPLHDGNPVEALASNITRLDTLSHMGSTSGSAKGFADMGYSVAEGAQLTSHLKSMQGTSEATSLEGLKHRYETQQGHAVSDHDFYGMVAKFGLAPTGADIRATQGDPAKLEQFYYQNRSMDIPRMQAVEMLAATSGISLEQLGHVQGVYQESQLKGNYDAMKSLSPAEIALGYQVNSIRNGVDGVVTQEIGDKYEGGIRAFSEKVSRFNTSDGYGRFLAFSNLAQAEGNGLVETSVSTHSAGVSVAVSPSQVEKYEKAGLLNPEAATLLREEGGGTFTATMDPTSGVVLSGTTRTGRSFAVDNSTTRNDSTRVESGVQIGEQSAMQLASDKGEIVELEKVLRQVDKDPASREGFVVAIAHRLNDFSNSTIAASTSSQEQVGASAAAGIGGGSNSLGVSLGASGSHSRADNDSYPVNYAVARETFNTAETKAGYLARSIVNKEADAQFKEHGTSMSVDERQQRFEDVKIHQWAVNLQRDIPEIQKAYIDNNVRETHDADMRKDMKEKVYRAGGNDE